MNPPAACTRGAAWLSQVCALLQAVALHARSVEELYELLETLGR